MSLSYENQKNLAILMALITIAAWIMTIILSVKMTKILDTAQQWNETGYKMTKDPKGMTKLSDSCISKIKASLAFCYIYMLVPLVFIYFHDKMSEQTFMLGLMGSMVVCSVIFMALIVQIFNEIESNKDIQDKKPDENTKIVDYMTTTRNMSIAIFVMITITSVGFIVERKVKTTEPATTKSKFYYF